MSQQSHCVETCSFKLFFLVWCLRFPKIVIHHLTRSSSGDGATDFKSLLFLDFQPKHAVLVESLPPCGHRNCCQTLITWNSETQSPLLWKWNGTKHNKALARAWWSTRLELSIVVRSYFSDSENSSATLEMHNILLEKFRNISAMFWLCSLNYCRCCTLFWISV